jgi:hypothetical protein
MVAEDILEIDGALRETPNDWSVDPVRGAEISYDLHECGPPAGQAGRLGDRRLTRTSGPSRRRIRGPTAEIRDATSVRGRGVRMPFYISLIYNDYFSP